MRCLAKPTKEVDVAMSALGLSAVNADGSMKPLSQLIPEMQNKFAGLTDAEKGQYATMIAGKNALSGFLSLVNSSPDDFASLSDAINNSSGAAQINNAYKEAQIALKDYQPPEEYVDTMPPSVEMVGYTVRGGVAQSKKLVLNLYDDNKHYLNPSLPDLSGGS